MINRTRGNYRWFIVALLFVATCINYIDRQIIGLLKPILEVEFSWSETDFGFIMMAFSAAYAVGLLVSGGVIDRVGTRMGYTVSILVWSVAGMLHAVARTVTGFAAARIGLGIGEAGNFPAGVRAVAEWFPNKERGLATGIFNSGTSVGVVAALLIVPWILTNYGWHEVFWITGSFGFVWLILWLVFYQIPAKSRHLSKDELNYIVSGQDTEDNNKSRPAIRWVKLFSLPQTWAFITGKALIDPIFWFFLFWLPSYFSSTFSLDVSKPSLELMIIYAATTVGSIGGGYLSSLLIKKAGRY